MRLETNRHLEEAEIEKYSMGDTSEEESSRYEEHLLICETCQHRVTANDSYVTAMQAASAEVRRGGGEPEVRHTMISRPVFALAIAASVMLLAVVGYQRGGNLRPGVSGDGSPFEVSLVATRGTTIEAKAPAGRPLKLQLNLEGLQAESVYNLQIVDQVGKEVWKGSTGSQDSRAAVAAPRMTAGIYFLRTYSPRGKLLREYGLEVGAQ